MLESSSLFSYIYKSHLKLILRGIIIEDTRNTSPTCEAYGGKARFARWYPPAACFARPHHPTLAPLASPPTPLATLATPLQVGSKTAASNGLGVRIWGRGLGGRIEVAASRVKLRSRPRTTSEVGLRSRPRTISEVALDFNHYLKKCLLLWFFDTPNSRSASGLGGRGGQQRMT